MSNSEHDNSRPYQGIVSQITLARNEQGITQEQLAERTGIKRSNIGRLESGNYNPSLEFLSRVAHGLGMEIHVELRASDSALACSSASK